jgi:hypothetical protein
MTASFLCVAAVAQEPAGNTVDQERQLAEQFNRLELLAGRLAELSQSTQPRRAELLRALVVQSRERDLPGQFEAVVRSLEKESYSAAISGQTRLRGELEQLLQLLLQEDRDRRLEDERKRLRRYLQEINRIIRLQRGVKARTEGGDQPNLLAEDQALAGRETDELRQEIEDAEGLAEAKARREAQQGPQADGSAPDGASGGDSKGSSSPSDADSPKKPGEQESGGAEKPGGKPAGELPSDPARPAGSPSEGPAEGSPSSPSQGSPSQPGQGSAAGSPQEGAPPSPLPPMEEAAERLRTAQQRMQQAQSKLEKSLRDGAQEEQRMALEELEKAKAELERVLRQLREEEMERMLTLLEARFRKMLDEQVEIYDETKRLDAAATAPPHELEIAGGRLSRREGQLVREADRALVLLREDGTSVAFPEAVELCRDDMQSIAERLREVKFESLTQGLEEDVIAALEEALAALQQAIKDLKNQKNRPQPPAQGSPGEQPLVDQLAELRMIRALQAQVNRRTQRYGSLIEGEQAESTELLEALREEALRQQRVFQATRELEHRGE